MATAGRVELTAGHLRRRYVVNRLTATQIAVETGWSSQYVRDRLRDHGIPLRPWGLGKPRLGREQLQGWVEAGLTVPEIAERAGYSTSGVRKLIGEFQIPVPERIRPPLAGHRLLDELAAKYARGQSLEALGAEYGHTAVWVRARLVQAGVAIRPVGNRRKITTDQVRSGLDEGLRTREIASRLGCSDWAVLQVMRDQGWTALPPRPRGPSRSLARKSTRLDCLDRRPRRSTSSASCTPSRATPWLRSGECSTPPPRSCGNGSTRPAYRSSRAPPRGTLADQPCWPEWNAQPRYLT